MRGSAPRRWIVLAALLLATACASRSSDGGAEGYGYLPRLTRGKYGRISLLAAGAHEFESLGESLEELLEAVAAGH